MGTLLYVFEIWLILIFSTYTVPKGFEKQWHMREMGVHVTIINLHSLFRVWRIQLTCHVWFVVCLNPSQKYRLLLKSSATDFHLSKTPANPESRKTRYENKSSDWATAPREQCTSSEIYDVCMYVCRLCAQISLNGRGHGTHSEALQDKQSPGSALYSWMKQVLIQRRRGHGWMDRLQSVSQYVALAVVDGNSPHSESLIIR